MGCGPSREQVHAVSDTTAKPGTPSTAPATTNAPNTGKAASGSSGGSSKSQNKEAKSASSTPPSTPAKGGESERDNADLSLDMSEMGAKGPVARLRKESGLDLLVSPSSGAGTGRSSAASGGSSPGRGVDLGHAESRVQMALSSKRLHLQRRRRSDVVAESFGSKLKNLEDETFDFVKVDKPDAAKAFLRRALGANFLFSGLNDDLMASVIDAFAPVKHKAGKEIATQNEALSNFFVLETGECDVLVDGSVEGQLDAGAHFGDLSLLYNNASGSTVRTNTDCSFWTLDRSTFRGMLARADARDVQTNYRFLRKVKLLQGLPQRKLQKLAEALSPVKFSAADYIIKQGEEGNVFYIVKKGIVRVTKTAADGKEEDLLELAVGDHFGERALLMKEPRAANVVARGHVTCMALDREFFTDLLGPLEEGMKRTHTEREVLAKRNQTQRQESIRLEKKAEEEEKVELRSDIKMADLKPMTVLGEGAFGVVQLVKHKSSKEVFALKKMQKARVVKTGQQRNVMNEKKVLSTCRHPYILKLVATYEDRDCLYMLLEFLQGGDIFGHLYRQGGRFTYDISQYYAATVLSVLEYLHNKKVAYRDLKPENLVLDSRGHLKVVDFGFAKTVTDRTYTLCGTPEYLAPELVQGKGHNQAVDYWALGILIYEFFSGYSPFADDERNEQLTIYKNIIRGKIVFSSKLREDHVKDLILRLLAPNPSHRLGCLAGGANDVKAHRFFRTFDFDALMKKRLLPPLIPEIRGSTDTRNFDEVEVEAAIVTPYTEDNSWCEGFAT